MTGIGLTASSDLASESDFRASMAEAFSPPFHGSPPPPHALSTAAARTQAAALRIGYLMSESQISVGRNAAPNPRSETPDSAAKLGGCYSVHGRDSDPRVIGPSGVQRKSTLHFCMRSQECWEAFTHPGLLRNGSPFTRLTNSAKALQCLEEFSAAAYYGRIGLVCNATGNI
jgi:hypothetical protein